MIPKKFFQNLNDVHLIMNNSIFFSEYFWKRLFLRTRLLMQKTQKYMDFWSSHLNLFSKKIFLKFSKNSKIKIFQPQRTILKLLSISLKNCFLKDWRCRIASSTDAISQMDLFMTIVHGCQMLLMTYVTVSFI